MYELDMMSRTVKSVAGLVFYWPHLPLPQTFWTLLDSIGKSQLDAHCNQIYYIVPL